MKRIFIPLLLVALLLSGCFPGSQKSKNKILFVSILPLKYFTDKIVGDTYTVEVTVPPGVGPETYSPTPKQMMLLGEAKGYFSIDLVADAAKPGANPHQNAIVPAAAQDLPSKTVQWHS